MLIAVVEAREAREVMMINSFITLFVMSSRRNHPNNLCKQTAGISLGLTLIYSFAGDSVI